MIGKIKRYPNRYPKMFATLHEHPMFTNTKTFFLRSGCHTTERLYWSDFKSGRVNRLLKIQYSPLVRPCFETEKARLKIAFSLRFVFASKQKTDSLTEPAKQRYRRFSFGCDSFTIQRNKTNQNPDFRFPVCQIAQTDKMPFSRGSLFVRLGSAPNFGHRIP